MQPVAARSSWNEPAPNLVFGSPEHSDGASAEQPAPASARQGSQSGARQTLRVRRPGSAPASAGPVTAPLPLQQAAQPPAQPVPESQPAPAPFAFGTPGIGPGSSSVRARRPKARTPATAAAAPSPAFTTSSAASMAWSPYPASSSAEASTAFGGTATPEPPGSSTPTSGPSRATAEQAEAFTPGPAAVAEDLRSRLDLNAAAESGSTQNGSAETLTEQLRQRLNLGASQQGPAPDASPRPAPTAAARAGAAAAQAHAAGAHPAAPGGFSFVFGAPTAASPGPWAARATFRRAGKSPSSSPSSARQPSSSAAGSAAAAAAAAGEPSQQTTASQAASTGSSEATSGLGPSAAAAPGSQPAAAAGPPPSGGFVFTAASNIGSPGAQRVRPKAKQQQRSPSQGATTSPAQAAAAEGSSAPPAPATSQASAAPPASTASQGAAPPEPLRESQQQQAQKQAPQAWFVRVGDFAKQAASAAASPAFNASGASARRPSRRKGQAGARTSPASKAAAAATAKQPAAQQAAPAAAVWGQAAAAQPTVPPSPRPPAPDGSQWDAATQAAFAASEKYRSEGNEAFRDGDYTASYDLYTKALHALWPHPPLHPRLALLLSNRAAALLSQGKPLSALADCRMGLKYDAALMRCALRVATCHARMGDFDEAFQCVAGLREQAAGDPEQLASVASKHKDLEAQERQMYEALRMLGHAITAPQRDPATGAELQRSVSTGSGLSRASSSTAPADADALWEALKKVDDVAPHVPHSELLVAAKAEGLLRVGDLDRCREFCEQPIHLDEGPHTQQQQKRAPWRLWLLAQSSWQEGDSKGSLKQQLLELGKVLEDKERAEQAAPGSSNSSSGGAGGAAGVAAAASAFFPAAAGAAPAAAAPGSKQEARRQEQLAQLVGLPSSKDVKALLEGLEAADKRRLAGNAAVKAGKAAEAVQKYSEALAVGVLSPTIAAVLLSNRAAAHQHLKQRAQAIADCCRAAALNPQYAKAYSRLATLLSELGYHSDAAAALEKAVEAKGVSAADKREYQQRLASEKAAARRASSRSSSLSSQPAIDHYKLLGLERSAATEDVRRSYKKLALQLHPDKAASACRVALRCCGCGSTTFEAAAVPARLQERATWLFKLLGEANEVLSDPSKRRDLDHSLAMFGGAAASTSRPFAGFGNYSSYADSDDDSTDPYSYYNSYFGRRYGGFGGYGRSGGTAGGFGGAGYGAGFRGRSWGF